MTLIQPNNLTHPTISPLQESTQEFLLDSEVNISRLVLNFLKSFLSLLHESRSQANFAHQTSREKIGSHIDSKSLFNKAVSILHLAGLSHAAPLQDGTKIAIKSVLEALQVLGNGSLGEVDSFTALEKHSLENSLQEKQRVDSLIDKFMSHAQEIQRLQK